MRLFQSFVSYIQFIAFFIFAAYEVVRIADISSVYSVLVLDASNGPSSLGEAHHAAVPYTHAVIDQLIHDFLLESSLFSWSWMIWTLSCSNIRDRSIFWSIYWHWDRFLWRGIHLVRWRSRVCLIFLPALLIVLLRQCEQEIIETDCGYTVVKFLWSIEWLSEVWSLRMFPYRFLSPHTSEQSGCQWVASYL